MVSKTRPSSTWSSTSVLSPAPPSPPFSQNPTPSGPSDASRLPSRDASPRSGRCDIMISYHSSNARLLDRILPYLEERGFSVWHADPNSSDLHNARLKGKAVLDTKIFMFIVSQASLSHAPCKDEAALAYISGKTIIPLGVESYQDLEPFLDSAMKMLLAKLNWTFFVVEEDWDKHLPEMADSVSEAIGSLNMVDDDIFSPTDDNRLTDENEFDIEYSSMTEPRQRVYITLRRNLSIQQNDIMSGTFEGIDFWDVHFPEESTVATDRFVAAFMDSYGSTLTKNVDDSAVELLQEHHQLHHHRQQQEGRSSAEEWFRHLVTKDLFRETGSIHREVYNAICASYNNRAPFNVADAFYNRVKELAIGKLSMLKVFHMDSSVRLVAIQNLGSYQTPEIVASLTELLDDADPNVRTVATLALGRCKETPDVKAIVSRLLPMIRDADRLVRQAACISLGHLKAADAVKTLVDVWRNEPISDVREAALAALERMEGEDAKIAINMTKKLDQEMKRLALRP